MTDLARPATTTDPYLVSLLEILGSRDPLQVLAETPDALRRGIAGMSDLQLSTPEAPGKWSARQMLAHLADSELVGAFRFRMILAQDRPGIPAYDQDAWAGHLHYDQADVTAVLDTFAALRRANVLVLERATPEERQRVGIHAERGAESLHFLTQIYAGHDLRHLLQLTRIRAAVGA